MGLSPEINVEIYPEFFTFSYESQTIRVDTLVAVTTDDKRKVIAIGGNRHGPDDLPIALFSAIQDLPQDIDKLDLLTTFFEFSIGKLFANKKLPVLRPMMIFHGVQHLEKILCGYHLSIIKLAALNGGARGIRFD
jgi:hypothetical protein